MSDGNNIYDGPNFDEESSPVSSEYSPDPADSAPQSEEAQNVIPLPANAPKTRCNGNHSIKAPCADPECPKSMLPDVPNEAQAHEPSRDSFMVLLCIGLGKLAGLLQRFAGDCQTVLLHTAWRNGWRPGSREAVKGLRARVLNMEVRREMVAKIRGEKALQHQTEKLEKRFSKNYGSGK